MVPQNGDEREDSYLLSNFIHTHDEKLPYIAGGLGGGGTSDGRNFQMYLRYFFAKPIDPCSLHLLQTALQVG